MSTITKLSKDYYLFTDACEIIADIQVEKQPVLELLLLGIYSILDEIRSFTAPPSHSEINYQIVKSLTNIKNLISDQS